MDKYVVVEEHLEKFKKDKSHIEYFKKFDIYYYRSNPKYVKLVMEKVLKIAEENDYILEYGWCLNSIGWYYSDKCELDKAIEYHSKSNDIFMQSDDIKGIILTNNSLLVDYTKLGMFDMAIEYGLNGISIAEQSNNKELLSPLLMNTASAYLQSEYYKEALELLSRPEDLEYNMRDENKAIMYNTLAEIHLKCDDEELAYEYCNRAYELVQKYNYKVLLSETLSILGEISLKTRKVDEAQRYFEESIKYANIYKIVDIKIRTLIRWSKLNSYINNLKEGEKNLKEAVKEAKKINSSVLLKEIYEELSIIYIKLKDFESAYYSKEEYCKYEKEIFNQSSSVWFARLHSKTITQDAMIYKSLYKQIDIISQIGKRITSNLKKQSTFDAIYEEINMLLEADIFGIGLYNEKEKIVKYEFIIENGKKKGNPSFKTDNTKSFAAYCVNNKKDIIINDITMEYNDYKEAYEENKRKNENLPYSLIFCPLIKDEKVIGLLNLQSYNKNAYTIKDLNTLKILKTYITIAIENSILYDKTNYLAKHDSLTGVLNRREVLRLGKNLFDENIQKLEDFLILMLDVDHFKRINDTYSHNMGDCVLKKMTEIIKHELDDRGMIGRYGGEEFLIILPNVALEDGYIISENIRKSIENHKYIMNNEENLTVTVSIGVCALKYNNISFYNGIKIADEELYRAKNMGRNRVSMNFKLEKISDYK